MYVDRNGVIPSDDWVNANVRLDPEGETLLIDRLLECRTMRPRKPNGAVLKDPIERMTEESRTLRIPDERSAHPNAPERDLPPTAATLQSAVQVDAARYGHDPGSSPRASLNDDSDRRKCLERLSQEECRLEIGIPFGFVARSPGRRGYSYGGAGWISREHRVLQNYRQHRAAPSLSPAIWGSAFHECCGRPGRCDSGLSFQGEEGD
jgi:hypothetical protein